MRSGIGYYVHLNASNYNLYGTTFKGPKNTYDYGQQKKRIRERVAHQLAGFTEEDKEKMEMNLSDISQGLTDEYVQSVVADFLAQQFGEEIMQSIHLNWDTLEAERFSDEGLKNFLTTKEKNFINKITYKSNANAIRLNTIMQRVQKIQQCQAAIKSETEKKKLQQQIDEIYKILNSIVKTATGDIKTDMKNGSIIAQEIALQQAKPAVDIINTIIGYYCAGPVSTSVSEAFSELAVAAMTLKAEQDSVHTINAKIQEIIKTGGSSRHYNMYQANSFYSRVWDSFSLDRYIKTEDALVSILSSKNKVDMTIEIGNKNTNVSLKNYNLSGGFDIHLVQAAPLLYMIKDEPADFINHYLNLIADHPMDPRVKIDANHAAAHEAMKLTLLFYALVGYNQEKQVDTFVIRDKYTQRVRIYSIPQLWARITSNPSYSSIETKEGKPIEEITLINNREITWPKRISNLLIDAHRQKISASLSPRLFQKEFAGKLDNYEN